jgi:hypothetical protein
MNIKYFLSLLFVVLCVSLRASEVNLNTEVNAQGKASDYIEVVSATQIPPNLGSTRAGIPSRLKLINRTPWYLCLAWIDPNGNLHHGWTDAKGPSCTVFYVAPGGKTNPNGEYMPHTG